MTDSPQHSHPAGPQQTAGCPRWLWVASRTASTVLSPLLVPTYGVFLALWLTVLRALPASSRWIVTAIVFATTCLLPLLAIYSLWRAKAISDPGLNKREERTTPYIVTAICYAGCAYYLFVFHAPQWLWAFPAGGAVAVLVCLGINFKWKISAHLAGMGGLTAELFRIAADGVNMVYMPVWITGAVLLTGFLATARVVMHRHTVGQTLAGTAVGFLAVFLLSM